MNKRLIIIAVVLRLISIDYSYGQQDTITVMVYNLLYYGVNTSFCTSSNNPVDAKDVNLQRIISHTLPDIFAVNELGRGQQNTDRILEQVLNTNDRDYYSHATYTNTANSTIVNMLFYRHDKFVLYSEAIVSDIVRDINLYTLYHRSPGLEAGDTTFISCIVAHFKAGSSNGDQQSRLLEAQSMMGYIAQNQLRGNVLLMGDFNMKSSYESAYGLITYHPNQEIRFFDPVDKPGSWVDNPEFAMYHSQSTRSGSQACFVSGGLDDRFDQILVSRPVLTGQQGIRYIDNSYKVLGQDGQRLNQSLIDPPNISEPKEIIMALYNMSDHLPVLIKLAVGDMSSDLLADVSRPVKRIAGLVNPTGNLLRFQLLSEHGSVRIELLSMQGGVVFSQNVSHDFPGQYYAFDISSVPEGVYILYVRQGNRVVASERIVR